MTNINRAGLIELLRKTNNGHRTVYRDRFAAIFAVNAQFHRTMEIAEELAAYMPGSSFPWEFDEYAEYEAVREAFADAAEEYDVLKWPEGVAEEWADAEDNKLEELFSEVRAKIPPAAFSDAATLHEFVRVTISTEIEYLIPA
jgi:DNA repair exonuclease SbcCD nuclease subunit